MNRLNGIEKPERDIPKDRETTIALANNRWVGVLSTVAAVSFGVAGLEIINHDILTGVVVLAGAAALAGTATNASYRHQEILAGRFLPKF
jgi:hypothetical protein